MSVLKCITGLPFRFGGEEHSGWLPPGAAKPLPTPIEDVVLDVEIQSDPSGFLLCWNSRDGKRCGDNWFQTLTEAENAGRDYFGIEPNQWVTK
jgi:hypothetical protein